MVFEKIPYVWCFWYSLGSHSSLILSKAEKTVFSVNTRAMVFWHCSCTFIKNVFHWLAIAGKWGPGWCYCDMWLLKANFEQRGFRTIQKVTTISMKENHFSPVLWLTSKTSLWLTPQTDISLLNNFDSNNIEFLMDLSPGNILMSSLFHIIMTFQNNLQGKQSIFLL